jgi:hypothetical protein
MKIYFQKSFLKKKRHKTILATACTCGMLSNRGTTTSWNAPPYWISKFTLKLVAFTLQDIY